jgi:lauroyl/myristoyl acyltransferase
MSRVPSWVHDAGLGARVTAAVLTAALLPERLWLPLGRTIGRAQTAGHARVSERDLALAEICHEPARSIAIERIASGHAARLRGLREYARPARAWPIDVDGFSRIEEARAAGRGAILWIGRFTWASLIAKVGLQRAGLAVSHLSRPTHGFGESAFAVRRLNPIWTRIEERFVHERIVMKPAAGAAALRALHERLQANGVVSITVGDEGARVVAVPFLGGTLRLASGPASLATASGAPLLPVFVVRNGNGRFRVAIEPALELHPEDPRDRRGPRIAEGYAARLEPWVRRYPGQWLG